MQISLKWGWLWKSGENDGSQMKRKEPEVHRSSHSGEDRPESRDSRRWPCGMEKAQRKPASWGSSVVTVFYTAGWWCALCHCSCGIHVSQAAHPPPYLHLQFCHFDMCGGFRSHPRLVLGSSLLWVSATPNYSLLCYVLVGKEQI